MIEVGSRMMSGQSFRDQLLEHWSQLCDVQLHHEIFGTSCPGEDHLGMILILISEIRAKLGVIVCTLDDPPSGQVYSLSTDAFRTRWDLQVIRGD